MTPYFSKEDRLTCVVKSIDSQALKRAGTVLCRNSIWGGTNYSSSTNFSSFKPSGTRGRRSGFHWCGSALPLTRLASPPLHFLPPASVPAHSFHCTGQHRPPELLPISSAAHQLCTNSGKERGQGEPEHAPAAEMYRTGEGWQAEMVLTTSGEASRYLK